jgi:hypothetical protein
MGLTGPMSIISLIHDAPKDLYFKGYFGGDNNLLFKVIVSPAL